MYEFVILKMIIFEYVYLLFMGFDCKDLFMFYLLKMLLLLDDIVILIIVCIKFNFSFLVFVKICRKIRKVWRMSIFKKYKLVEYNNVVFYLIIWFVCVVEGDYKIL